MSCHEKIKNFIRDNLLPRSKSEAIKEAIKWFCFIVMIMMLLDSTYIFKSGFETGYAFCIGNTSNTIMQSTKNMSFNYSVNIIYQEENSTPKTIDNEK